MIPLRHLEQRFMKDSTPLKLGALASDLARLANLARSREVDVCALQNILTEIKFFTEWVGKEVSLSAQQIILSLQRTLAHWKTEELSAEKCFEIEQESKKWSDVILGIYGLLVK